MGYWGTMGYYGVLGGTMGYHKPCTMYYVLWPCTIPPHRPPTLTQALKPNHCLLLRKRRCGVETEPSTWGSSTTVGSTESEVLSKAPSRRERRSVVGLSLCHSKLMMFWIRTKIAQGWLFSCTVGFYGAPCTMGYYVQWGSMGYRYVVCAQWTYWTWWSCKLLNWNTYTFRQPRSAIYHIWLKNLF